MLAFNRKAAEEIGKKIAAVLGLPTFPNARNFHSLAFQLVQPPSRILYDRSDEPFARDLSQFIQNVLRQIWNPAFQAHMYLVFRAELQELERTGSLLDGSDYLTFRRNLSHITLAGEYVKSQGVFPLIHPYFTLFRLFGDSEQQILEDERRLFYVARTRAKEQVWFLTETDRESDFVRELMGTEMPNQSIHLTGKPRRVPGI